MAHRPRDVTRRALLASLTAAAALPAADVPIIDTHTHFYDPERAQGVPWPPKTDAVLYQKTLPDRFVSLTKPLGVTGTVVVEASPWLEDNQWVLDLAKDHPVIVGVIGNLSPGTPEFREHLARFGRNPIFRGIRLNGAAVRAGLAQRGFLTDLQRLAGGGLVLDVVGDPSMLPAVLTLADKVRQLRIVIDHLPFYGMNAAGRNTLAQIARTGNVSLKVSWVVRKDGTREQYAKAIDELWKLFGLERLIYGSNWPVSDKIAPYSEVLDAVMGYFGDAGVDARRAFFFHNSRRFYRWRATAPPPSRGPA
jgi:predicted TIM-barrel fold metal-dependent hydrolase